MPLLSHRRGFTLIELLVTILIISLLAGLLLPALHRARNEAWNRRAGGDLEQLVVAWNSYLTDRYAWPDESITEMSSSAVKILGGSNIVHNPLGIAYLEFMQDQHESGWKDHWGSIYQVTLDNGQGRDAAANDHQVVGPGGAAMQRRVVVWSLGLDREEGTKDDIVRF